MTGTALQPNVATAASEPRSQAPAWEQASRRRAPVAYIVSRFPKPTETFVVSELLAVEEHGTPVTLFSIWRENPTLIQPDAVRLLDRVRYAPFFSWSIARAHAYFLTRRPAAYFAALLTLIRSTLGSPRYFFGGLALFPKSVLFARQMTEAGIRHIHAHFASHPAAAAFVIHRLTGIPYSFTAHGSDLHRDRHMLAEKVASATRVITVAEYNRRVIIEHCGEAVADKVSVIHCGVNARVFRPSSTAARPDRDTRPTTVVCIGTLHAVKGQTFLLQACRLLRQRGCPVTCELIGEGPDLDRLRLQATQLGIDDAVVFHGPLTRDGVIEILRRADIVVAPSVPTSDGRREGIPVALMEAMASGVAVVASDLSGIPELVVDGQTGLLVPPGDVDSLARAIERLQRDVELRGRLAEAGRQKVIREFNVSANAAALVKVFTGDFSRRPRHD
jgi:colanic acid/amylovoran biosynthesis glycosyltransferase